MTGAKENAWLANRSMNKQNEIYYSTITLIFFSSQTQDGITIYHIYKKSKLSHWDDCTLSEIKPNAEPVIRCRTISPPLHSSNFISGTFIFSPFPLFLFHVPCLVVGQFIWLRGSGLRWGRRDPELQRRSEWGSCPRRDAAAGRCHGRPRLPRCRWRTRPPARSDPRSDLRPDARNSCHTHTTIR